MPFSEAIAWRRHFATHPPTFEILDCHLATLEAMFASFAGGGKGAKPKPKDFMLVGREPSKAKPPGEFDLAGYIQRARIVVKTDSTGKD